MLTNSLVISSKGQVTIPKAVRDILSSNIVMFKINDNDEILLVPVKDTAGRLAAYSKNTSMSFKDVREQAWKASTNVQLQNSDK